MVWRHRYEGGSQCAPDVYKRQRKNRVHRTPKCAELPEKYGARQQEFMLALYTGIRADEAEQAAGVLARMLENLEKMQTVEEGLE